MLKNFKIKKLFLEITCWGFVLDCFSYLIILSATSITITNYYNHQHITYITSAFEKIEEDQLRLVESNKKEQILEQYYIYSFAIKKN
jgi:hypothetical protein